MIPKGVYTKEGMSLGHTLLIDFCLQYLQLI